MYELLEEEKVIKILKMWTHYSYKVTHRAKIALWL